MSTTRPCPLEILTHGEWKQVVDRGYGQWPCQRPWGTLIAYCSAYGDVRFATTTDSDAKRRLRFAVQGRGGRLVPRRLPLLVLSALSVYPLVLGATRWTTLLCAVLVIATAAEAARAGWFRPIALHPVRVGGELEHLLALEAAAKDQGLLARMIAAGRDWRSLEQSGTAELVRAADRATRLATTVRPDYAERIAAVVIDAATSEELVAAQTALDDLCRDLQPLADARREEADRPRREAAAQAEAQAASERELAAQGARQALAGVPQSGDDWRSHLRSER